MPIAFQKKPRVAVRALKGFLTAIFCAMAMTLLMADGNACCGGPAGGPCDQQGCDNNWICTGVVLNEISSCCGMGSGAATCNEGDWCVDCDEVQKHCGACDDPPEM
jgi:hypothetical protein